MLIIPAGAHKKSRSQARADLPTAEKINHQKPLAEWPSLGMGRRESGSHRRVSLDAMAGTNGARTASPVLVDSQKGSEKTFKRNERKYV
jgi:hypothetical protein